jgi:predicted DNA-binding antitoxin AbrB/MazE fold protein
MDNTVMAIYENGALHPLTPMALPELARVQIRVERVMPSIEPVEHRRLVREALVAAGLSLPIAPPPPALDLISAKRREELAYLFAAGRPLSEIIIEEREGR